MPLNKANIGWYRYLDMSRCIPNNYTLHQISYKFEQRMILFYLVKATANSLCFEHDVPLFRTVKDAMLCSSHASLWPPVAHSPRDPTAHDNSGVITSTVLTRFSVPPRLSTLCFKPSRLMIIRTLQTLSLPVSQLPLFQRQWTRLTKN